MADGLIRIYFKYTMQFVHSNYWRISQFGLITGWHCISSLPLLQCIPNASTTPCPICLDELHSSREGISIPKCGHLIHTHCLKSMADQGLYRCPTCNASILNMDHHWKHLAEEVKAWPMPRRYKNFFVEVLCNDCHKVNKVKYHIIAMKCKECPSFNTRRTGQESPPDETDSELSSDSDADLSGDESATPFERHISQLLRTLSARVRAIDSDDHDFADHAPSHSVHFNGDQPIDPLSADYEFQISDLYNQMALSDVDENDFADDDDDDDSFSSDSWETESEEVVSNQGTKDSLDSLDRLDSSYNEGEGSPSYYSPPSSLLTPRSAGEEGSEDLSQGCSIM